MRTRAKPPEKGTEWGAVESRPTLRRRHETEMKQGGKTNWG